MERSFFPLLILNARPAAGKSELIQALADLPLEARSARFHIGAMKVIDDFPYLWAWFEEDQILEQEFGRPRLYTTPDGYFLHDDLWHLLLRRLCLDYEKWMRDTTEAHTVILEFSRGAEHGGYRSAYQHLTDSVLATASCLYLDVSFDESDRKNRARFNPQRPDSILQHGLETEKLARLYGEDDWAAFTAADPHFLQAGTHRLPYVVFDNHDDVTTRGGAALLDRLEGCLSRLWALRASSPTV